MFIYICIQIRNIDDFSNTDLAGLWIYKIGRIDTDESVVQPDDAFTGLYIFISAAII